MFLVASTILSTSVFFFNFGFSWLVYLPNMGYSLVSLNSYSLRQLLGHSHLFLTILVFYDLLFTNVFLRCFNYRFLCLFIGLLLGSSWSGFETSKVWVWDIIEILILFGFFLFQLSMHCYGFGVSITCSLFYYFLVLFSSVDVSSRHKFFTKSAFLPDFYKPDSYINFSFLLIYAHLVFFCFLFKNSIVPDFNFAKYTIGVVPQTHF